MLAGVVLLWFILTAISVVFVAVDITRTPESCERSCNRDPSRARKVDPPGNRVLGLGA